MQRIANFLSARDLIALGATCARNRDLISARDAWSQQIRARFPYKQCAEQCNPRNFLLLLEDRITYGQNRAQVHHRASDIVLRGDIIIDDETRRKYVYDGLIACPIKHKRWDHLSEYLDLREVFSVPLEFCANYYDDLSKPCNIIMRIDKRAKLREKCSDMCTFECNDRYNIFIDRDYTFETIKKAVDDDIAFVLCRFESTDSRYFMLPAEWYLESDA